MSISILIADDHKMVREGFLALISQNPAFEVVAEAADGREAFELATKYRPDIILMDIGMPGLNGIDACRKILKVASGIKIIGVSMYSSNPAVIEMLRAGAAGYIEKLTGFEEVFVAIETVLGGNQYISPSIARVVVNEAINKDEDASPNVFNTLSMREREVFQLFAEGKTSKEIAYLLEISGRTVDAHRKNVMQKLGLNTLADLARCAFAQKIFSPLELKDRVSEC